MKYNCPICKATTDSEKDVDFPFCSERCRLLDLGAWAAEKYVVSEPIFDEEETPGPDRRALCEGRPASEGEPNKSTRIPDEPIH